MANKMQFRVYDPDGTPVAACRFAEDAAAVVASHGEGAQVKYRRAVVFTEGDEAWTAADSFDRAAEIMMDKIDGA